MEKYRMSKSVTKMLDYGLFVVKNFDQTQQTPILASYYVMPRYSMSLEKALRAVDLDQE